MKARFSKIHYFLSALVFLAMIVGLSVPTFKAQAASPTILVDKLQPTWGVPGDGGGGVYSAYYGPTAYAAVSPGATALYDGREAAPIYAGVNIDVDTHYYDQGLFGFKPGDVPIGTFAAQPFTYTFENQYGTAPVWVYIELNKGIAGDIMYQYVPSSNPTGWHTEDAASGTHWQAWTNTTDGITTGPMRSLADIATLDGSKTVSRIYLTEGMGDSYHSNPNGTVAWVDKVTIGSVTYDFVQEKYWYVDPTTGSDTINKGSFASPFLTIQHAITAAAPGDTINVAPGTFTEVLNITKSLTLKGAEFNVNVSGRTAASVSESTIQGLVTVDASDVAINGFTLTDPGQTYAMVLAKHIPSNSNIAITYNIIDNIGAVGLAQNVHAINVNSGPDSVTISHNRFNNINASTKTVSAIGVLDSVSTDPSNGLLIQDNTFANIASGTKGAYGIIINNKAGAPNAQILDNTFSGLSGGWTHAIGLEGPTPEAIVSGNVFSGLTAPGADNVAIWFEANPVGNTVTVYHNQFNGNGFFGVGINPADVAAYNYTVNAGQNWWNAVSGPGSSGPGTGALAGPNVSFNPWCGEAACTSLIYLNPPQTPSNFYGFIYTSAGSPSAGGTVNAYVAGVTAPISATIITDSGKLAYQMDIPGDLDSTPAKDGGVEGDLITFKINNVVVGTGYWHSGTDAELNFAGVTLSNLSQVYDGSAKPATVVTAPVGLAVTTTYDGSASVPINAGSYAVVATVTSPNYAGIASGTLIISPATSTVTVTCPLTPQTYTGFAITPCTASYSTSDGQNGVLTVNYSDNVSVGTANASATYLGDSNHTGNSGSATFAIAKATATITLSNLDQVFDGTQKFVTVVTSPPGLSVSVIYTPDGTTTAPSAAGTYAVLATITDPNYSGTATATMHIQSTHTISLVPGWNLVSFNLVPMDTSIATVLASISGKYDLVYGWDGSVGSNNWSKYAPGGPSYANTLTALHETMGFWIHMSTAATLNVVGNAPTSTNITLSSAGGGWNLVGFPSASGSLGSTPLDGVLSSHGVSAFTLVYAYHAYDTADLWKLFDIGAPAFADDLNFLSPGWGYWIKVSGIPQTWAVGY